MDDVDPEAGRGQRILTTVGVNGRVCMVPSAYDDALKEDSSGEKEHYTVLTSPLW